MNKKTQKSPVSFETDNKLNIALTVATTQAEGPGNRFAIWVQGCAIRCPGCCNQEMLDFEIKSLCTADELIRQVLYTRNKGIEGISLLGGEPLHQARLLAKLAKCVRDHSLSVMVYSGYTYKHIMKSDNPDWLALIAQTDLLISGPYIEKQRSTQRRWIGSDNQQIHFLSNRYAHLQTDFRGLDKNTNSIEINFKNGNLTVNGFPTLKVEQWKQAMESTQNLPQNKPDKNRKSTE